MPYNNLKQDKIAILAGGDSTEREVSLKSGKSVFLALQSKGYNVSFLDTKEYNLFNLKKDGFTRVYNVLHGGIGENGELQNLLDILNIPYTGIDAIAAKVSFDKLLSKIIWGRANLPIIPHLVVTQQHKDLLDGTWQENVIAKLGLPIFIKPTTDGSSVGVHKIKEAQDLIPKVQELLTNYPEILLEKFINGKEYSITVLEDKAMDLIEIIPANEFYDYNAKYISDATQYICPAPLDTTKTQEVRAIVEKAAHALGIGKFSRIDLLADTENNFFLLEVNSCPGMTDHSLSPLNAKTVGLSYADFCEKILQLSID